MEVKCEATDNNFITMVLNTKTKKLTQSSGIREKHFRPNQ